MFTRAQRRSHKLKTARARDGRKTSAVRVTCARVTTVVLLYARLNIHVFFHTEPDDLFVWKTRAAAGLNRVSRIARDNNVCGTKQIIKI